MTTSSPAQPSLLLLEPAPGPEWAPFAGVRPIAELRAGRWRIRERWEAALGTRADALLGAHVAGFHELDEPAVRAEDGASLRGPAIVARADFAPAAGRLTLPAGARRLTHSGATVAWILRDGESLAACEAAEPAIEIAGLALAGIYDLLTALEVLLPADCELDSGRGDGVPAGSIVLGDARRVVVLGATVEPGVVFDVRHGAVVLEAGVEVRHGSRLEGPLYAGPGTRLLGGHLRASSFGPRCSVKGEVSNTVFVGYANKSHDGFVGHSVLGHWVNLGALTTTSNLKNTYGPVRLEVAGRRIETGRQFLGALFGDHAKVAIGTMLATGTVVSAGANVFGTTTPKYVPPFAWGAGGAERLTEDGFLRIAERVMPRRDVALTAERRASLAATWRRLCP